MTRTLFDRVEINWEALTGPKLASIRASSSPVLRYRVPSPLPVLDDDLRSSLAFGLKGRLYLNTWSLVPGSCILRAATRITRASACIVFAKCR